MLEFKTVTCIEKTYICVMNTNIYINFVCHVYILDIQICQYIYQKQKTRHLFLNELYFGFFQTFEE